MKRLNSRRLLVLALTSLLLLSSGAPGQNVNVIKAQGAASYKVTRVTASTSPVTWVPQRLGRRAVTLYNLDASITVYYKEAGGAAVTSSNGFPLGPGASKVVNTTAALQVVAASGNPALVADEEYD